MSRRTFTRHFQKATGMTVVAWLVSERLRQGRELLETTSLSVEAIAERIGFHTATSFRQHFKQHHRVSPRDWRKTFGETA
ncbi:transcriptional regulator GlxA family with amidase domain [Halomonas cerina]|uniref:Transcriptional regulator GlxA family with amidase domain n=2 Tax=Halomonas cerina TaxID=447424 RepID=A0A839VG64_9GAMM|nr:transcriptional regulator GlxA family with amidase domain [Halomonas cerina]